MLRVIPVIFSVILITSWSCQPEEEQFTYDESARLRFSTDTVYFDTLFTTLGSVTKRFRVYNDANNAVNISQVRLAGGTSSPFTIYANGESGPVVNDVRILGGDSILMLAEVTIDPQDSQLPFIVTDQIEFETNGNQQHVDLVAWGQDANFLRDSVLTCDATWTAGKPYVIYNSVLIDQGCKLTIEPGARVYSHNGSFIFVAGTLQAMGLPDNRITFTNDRFDEPFDNAPGQWGGLIFLQGSDDNSIDYTDIRNANIGIYLGTPDDDDDPDLVLANTRIENIGGNTVLPSIDSLIQPGYGILAITSDLYAYNTLINNCQLNVAAHVAGGNYRYEHCTLANFSFDFIRREPIALFANNLLLGDDRLLVADIHVAMQNNIIWGGLREEIIFSNVEDVDFIMAIDNNIIKTTDETLLTENINIDPEFFDPAAYHYHLDTLSPAKDAGIPLGINLDHEGIMRDEKPDLGAFERIEN